MYKYEMHCHTVYSSACSDMPADEIVNMYLANGYDGIVVTDHFLNGSTTVYSRLPGGTYEEQIDLFCRGYEQVKEAAGNKLKVFFGLEFSYKGTDILAYGFDKESLKQFPQLPDMDMRSFIRLCKDMGVLTVQAHPFREADYIDHIRLYPECEGVETLNACRDALCNDLGAYYAKAYQKIAIGGSDIHHTNQKMLSGMAFEEEIFSLQQLVSFLRAGKGQIIYSSNQYKR